MANSEIYFRKITWTAMLREDPRRRLEKGKPGKKQYGNESHGNKNEDRCGTH